jgi:threonine/homoserine/homoserine lactone efflux protein
MITLSDLLIFALAAFAIVITPGPNMVYLISRSITQGKKAGIISLAGVICGFLFHITMAAFGLTAVLFAVPFTFTALKITGAAYLLYLAFNAVKSGSKNIFETRKDIKQDKPLRLFMMGFLTNVLNPKMAVFYLSLFPQFIKPEAGSVALQCFYLGFTQMTISFTFNFLIIMSAAKAAKWFSQNPVWVRAQQWFMATVLTTLAIRLIFSKAR